MKIIKYGIVAVIGAFLLPAPPENEFMVSNTGQRINLETGEVLAAAASTYSDVTSFCERQSAVCNTAGQVWTSLEIKAKYNFQRIYEWSNGTRPHDANRDRMKIPTLPPALEQPVASQVPERQIPVKTSQKMSAAQIGLSLIYTGSIKGSIKGSINKQMANANTNNNTNNTLQIEDLIPEWRGPVLTGTG